VHRVVLGLEVLGNIVHLGVAVVAGGDAIGGTGRPDLFQFDLPKVLRASLKPACKNPPPPPQQ
jgi:hypothetical protein